MAKIKRIEVFSTAKMSGGVMILAGLLAGVVYSFGGLIIDALVSAGWITSTETPGLSYGTVLAFGALIGMPIIFGTFGLAAGAVGAFFYNIVAKRLGGIEIDLDQ